jgi:hypothetical protein
MKLLKIHLSYALVYPTCIHKMLYVFWISFTPEGSTELLGLVPSTTYLNLSILQLD